MDGDEIWKAIKERPGASPEAVPPASLAGALDHSAVRFPGRRHVTWNGLALTYAQTLTLTERLALGLRSRGIGRGDRVGLLLPSHPAYVLAAFALWRLGAIGVGMNPLYAQPMLSTIAADAGLKLLLTLDDPALLEKARAAAPGVPVEAFRADGGVNALFAEAGALAPVEVDPRRDLAMLQYTGGTTGAPKGVMLTHANLAYSSLQLRSGFPKMRPGAEAALVAMPFSHIAALSVGLIFVTALAGELVIMDRFSAGGALRLIAARRISYLPISPTVLIALARAPDAAATDWSSVRHVFSGAAPLPDSVKREFHGLTGATVRPIYGMTEASPNVVLAPEETAATSSSVGVPYPATRLSIRAADDPAREVAPGDVGEVCIAGPQIMAGYWRRPAETAAAFVGDFFRSGDLGYLDADGALHLVGRLKDTINTSGYKVYPDAIEEAVRGHPAVAEALVIGAPDPYRGEAVKACVVLRPDAALTLADLQQFLCGVLSPMELPTLLEIRPVLPLTPVGKPSRQALREELGAGDALVAPAGLTA